MSKHQLVFNTSLIIVQHFRNLHQNGTGFHSRIFQHMLHPEFNFVGSGVSLEAENSDHIHPEHVVPCAFMIEEIRRLLSENILTDSEIALLLQKHWKIVKITKEQAKKLDSELGLKSKMPEGWRFETGDTFERLHLANIDFNEINAALN